MCDEVLPTAGGHVLSPILTCRSIPDLTVVGSTSCLYLSVCPSSTYHPSLCLHMHVDYGICVELRAQLYGTGSLYLHMHPGDQTQVIRFALVLGSKHNSCVLWELRVSARLFPAVLKLMPLDRSVLCKGVGRTLDEVVPTHLDPELAPR